MPPGFVLFVLLLCFALWSAFQNGDDRGFGQKPDLTVWLEMPRPARALCRYYSPVMEIYDIRLNYISIYHDINI